MKPFTWSPRATTALRRGAAVTAALLVALAAAGVPATAAEGPSREEVYKQLGVAEQPVDYVILVDTSGSMKAKGRYDTVRSTLRSFLGGLTPADHVALITFDDRPEARYIGSAEDPAAIVGRLPKKPDANGGTDIGAALDQGLRELERDDAASVASVVMLTDGKHQPPRRSTYPKSSGPPWKALRKRADALAGHTELAGYALPLASGASGADRLGDVVDNTVVLRPGSIQDLGRYLQRAGDSTRARSAAKLLADDKGKGVTASWRTAGARDVTDGSATASVTFRSATARVPLTVSDTRVSVAGAPLDVSGVPRRLTLDPGESRTYSVHLTGKPGGGGSFRHTEGASAALRVSGKVSSPWQQALAPDLNLKVPASVGTTGDPLRVRAEVGSALLLPGILLVLVAVPVLVALRWLRVNRPALTGVLTAAPVFANAIPDRFPLTGRRVTFRPHGGGLGTVHGRRRRTAQGPRVDLMIRYVPDGVTGRPDRVVCAPGARAVVGGLAFTHRTDGATAAPGYAGVRPEGPR
ncbi:VWA domain-containing protein [Streptomyces sp. NBC_01420]|uniref:vWA domain-containing protein n=1 Tax=Streptomyces sp. NBC_01420 TaxID=2903858 RepID=UPI003256186A